MRLARDLEAQAPHHFQTEGKAMTTKAELIKAISEETGETQGVVSVVLAALEDKVAENLKNKTELNLGFIKFKTVEKAARPGRNPKTGEPQEVSARTAVKVVVTKKLKDAANGESK